MDNDGTAGDGLAHSNISTQKPLTRANLKIYQQGISSAGADETAVQRWLAESCDRSLGGRAAESWKRLVAEDKLAADIEAAMRPGDRK